MPDYDLGTAHGKIVVDYQDKGTGKAVKDLDALKAKAGELLTRFAGLAKGWRSHSQGMVADVTRIARSVGVFAGALAVGVGLLNKSRGAFLAYKGIGQIFGALGLSMGAVPKGAEGFPSVIKKVIQLSAAITLFAGATKLIQTVASRFALFRGLGNLIGNFGSRVDGLARPLHRVAGVALAAAGAINTFRTVKAIIAPTLKAAGAVGALGGAFVLLGGLVQSVKQLTGVVGLLPAVLGAAGLAMATVKVGVMGLDEAFKNMDDPAKFAEALKKLSPAAREFAIAVKGQKAAFKELQLDVQQKLFQGLGKVVNDVAGKYMPLLRKSMGNVATMLNGMVYGISRVLTSGQGFTNMSLALGAFETIIGNVSKAVPFLVSAFLGIMRISGQVFAPLSGGIVDAARRFDEFVNSAQGATKIKGWILGGIQALKDLWAIVKNVSATFKTMWVALNGGESTSFLTTLAMATQRMREFVASAEGQRILALLATVIQTLWQKLIMLGDAFVTYVLPVLERFLPIVTAIGSGIMTGIVVALSILNPLFMALGAILGPLAPVFQVIATVGAAFVVTLIGIGIAAKIAFVAFNTLSTAFTVVRVSIQLTIFLIKLLGGALLSGLKNLAVWVIQHTIAAARTAAAWLVAKVQVIAHWIAMGVAATVNALRVGAAWLMQTILTTTRIVSLWIIAGAQIMLRWTLMAAAATANAIRVGAAWLLTTGASMATALASMAVGVARVVAGWVLMGVQAMLGAARVAAAWFIALGPIGWAIAAVIAVVALIIANWDKVKAATQAAWSAVSGAVSRAWDAIWAVIGPTMNRIGTAISNGFNRAKAVVDTVMNAIKIVVQTVIQVVVALFTGNFNRIPGILQSAGSRMNALFGGALSALKSAVMSGLAAVVSFFSGIPGRILGALGNLGGLLIGAGRAVLDGFLNGLRNAWGAVQNFVGGIASWISANKGPISTDRKLLTPAGNAIMFGLVNGMRQSMPMLEKMVGNITDTVQGVGNLQGRVNLQGSATVGNTVAATGASTPKAWTGGPVRGGEGATAPSYHIDKVEIPAKDLEEMKTVSDFFDKVQQKARAGKAGS